MVDELTTHREGGADTLQHPEVLFHRYFQTELNYTERQIFRGKADVYELADAESELLLSVQQVLNRALANERADDPDRSPDDRFHFDYIDSDSLNALAFCHGGYSFIGMTMPLVRSLFMVCARLSEDEDVMGLLGLKVPNLFLAAAARIQIFFIVSHEYTHHIHGHVRQLSGDSALTEYGCPVGADVIGRHCLELDADAYAVYLALTNLIAGEERRAAVAALGIETNPSAQQDRILLATFIVSVGAHFLSRSKRLFDVANSSHPPAAARMQFVMEHVRFWCRDLHPGLHPWITPEVFHELMAVTARATWPPDGVEAWENQIAFLTSDQGHAYTAELAAALDAYKSKL